MTDRDRILDEARRRLGTKTGTPDRSPAETAEHFVVHGLLLAVGIVDAADTEISRG